MEDLDLGNWNMAKQKLQFYSGSWVFYTDKTTFSYGRHKRYTTVQLGDKRTKIYAKRVNA